VAAQAGGGDIDVSAVLATSGLSVRFGGVHAVEGVDLAVEEGQLVGLIGPNGAGKTTFIDAITGFVRYTGVVELDGQDLAGLPPHARARRGLARTWQSTELFDDLTVRENLEVGAERPSFFALAAEVVGRRIPAGASAGDALTLLDLDGIADAMPAELTQGQRKLVGVARAIAMRPRLLCLDEPAAGLDTRESEDLGQRLRQIADAGTTTLLIDHDMGLVLTICDSIVVLEFGKVIAAGPPDQVRRDARVVKAYLGGEAASQEAEAIAPDRDEAEAGRT
jgi:branched-chain amino acid transport system ATP-binding protein